MTIQENLNYIRKKIDESVNPQAKILVVTKYAEIDQIIEAYEAGARRFGENYVKAALEKQEELKGFFKEKVEWHLIGHLQKNKVKKAVGNFDVIQSIDSLKLAQLVDLEAEKQSLCQDVFIQINSTGEDAKSGLAPEEFKKFYSEFSKLNNINIRGLMTMGPSGFKNNSKYFSEMETIFTMMRQLKSEVVSDHRCELSMGMTSDFELAIQQGSTIIRIGKGVFEGLVRKD